MTVILIIIGIMFLILLAWMWHSLGSIQKSTKFACIVGGIIIIYVITFIIYNVSKIGITYENKEAMKIIQTVYVLLFTVINGYIILPYVFKKIDKINNEEIEKRELNKSIIILFIIVLILGIFESSYLKSNQQRIIEINMQTSQNSNL